MMDSNQTNRDNNHSAVVRKNGVSKLADGEDTAAVVAQLHEKHISEA
jgi:hypothetical protein